MSEQQTTGATASGADRSARPHRPVRRADAAYLRRAALHYLDRYNATSASLRAVLQRRVQRSLRAHPAEGEHTAQCLHQAVEALIADFQRLGFIDDQAFALGRMRSLSRAGDSPRLMAQKLAAKGVAAEQIRRALDALVAESPAEDLPALARTAAWAYARRKGLGPYRPTPEARREQRLRDLARLARRGFSQADARAVIDAEQPPA